LDKRCEGVPVGARALDLSQSSTIFPSRSLFFGLKIVEDPRSIKKKKEKKFSLEVQFDFKTNQTFIKKKK
jgi:hypothetical protein